MKKITKILVVIVGFCMVACSKDSSSSTNTPASRLVKYEVISTSTGSFNAAFISESGAGVLEDFTVVPWTKTLTAQSTVNSVTMQTSISGGTPGKTFTARIYIGGVVKNDQTVTIPANGIAAIVLPGYVF